MCTRTLASGVSGEYDPYWSYILRGRSFTLSNEEALMVMPNALNFSLKFFRFVAVEDPELLVGYEHPKPLPWPRNYAHSHAPQLAYSPCPD